MCIKNNSFLEKTFKRSFSFVDNMDNESDYKDDDSINTPNETLNVQSEPQK